MSHDHDHGPVLSGDAPLRQRQRRVLRFVLAANAGFLGVEVVGGIAFGSLALLADAAHMLSDVAALTIALVAQTLADRPASGRHTFGMKRAEVVGAQANGVILAASSGWIVFEAVRRIGEPTDIDGLGLLLVASVGLAVNLGSAVALARVSAGNLNLRGAMAHLLADAAGSVAAMFSGVAVLVAGADWVDPVVSIFIAALVLWAAIDLLRDATQVVMMASPSSVDPDEVIARLAETEGVVDVHHLHVWSQGSDAPALSAHVVLEDDLLLHEAQQRGDVLRTLLADDFGIDHVTLELECHACEAPIHE
jgi:cobalt-zinc-cadmium efflux system protein